MAATPDARPIPSAASSPTMSSRPFTPPPSGSLLGRHVIYRGMNKSSMEYMSLTHSKNAEAAHMLKGEILISGQQSGYVQYTIVLDHQWMTRKVKMSALFGGQEKRLVLEVDQDQRWYRVTEHRLARSRSFFRSGLAQSQQSQSDGDSPASTSPCASSPSAVVASASEGIASHCHMQDAEAHLSDSSAGCYSSSSDSECSIPFEKINLTWTPPPKGSKRASKRFSSINPLRDAAVAPTLASTPEADSAKTTHDTHSASTSTTSSAMTSPTAGPAPSPVVGFAARSLSRNMSSSSLAGPKKYEHIPALDGCAHLDLGYLVSPSTFLLPLRKVTADVDPEKMRDFLAGLNDDDVLTERSALVSFPNLDLRPSTTSFSYAGRGHRPNFSLLECWHEDEELSTLVEVDGDGLVVRYGLHWARIPSS
ncbi:hypothetical protein BGW38_004485 [Lunasporangiospora selenospora]|uniref:Uncharacterized protein n=1 Tax=Lunasporangiospora selenospora TaxID=979761 RepID=A0A9P6G247_9FUNG|nr:hypothetical protein BGW38_004485 [Lunasporangiospora selenospora]